MYMVLTASQLRLVSLRELAKHLVARPELDDISVIRANITFGIPEQSAQMSRLCQRYGFQVVSTPKPTKMLQRAHRLGENILISFMALALNGNSLRRGTLRRDHVQVFLSRKLLEAQRPGHARRDKLALRPASSRRQSPLLRFPELVAREVAVEGRACARPRSRKAPTRLELPARAPA